MDPQQPTTTAPLLADPVTEEDFKALETHDPSQPYAHEWVVTVTTTDGQPHEGSVNRVGFMGFMLSGDDQGWLVLDLGGFGLEVVPREKIVSIHIDGAQPAHMDLAIDALSEFTKGARR